MKSLELKAWVNQNRNLIEGSYVKKVVDVSEGIVLEIYKQGIGRRFLHLLPSLGLVFHAKKKLLPSLQPMRGFVQKIKKEVEGKRITSIKQHNFERILEISLGDETKLVVELFSSGNIVLVKNGMILSAMVQRAWRHREIKVGKSYEYPPKVMDPFSVNKEEFKEFFKKSGKEIVRFLAKDMGLGGEFAEKLLAYVSVDKGARDLNEKDVEKILESLKNFESILELSDVNSKLVKRFEEIAQEKQEPSQKVDKRRETMLKTLEKMEKEAQELRAKAILLRDNIVEVEKAVEEGKDKVVINGEEIAINSEVSAYQNVVEYFEKAKEVERKIEKLRKVLEEEPSKQEPSKKKVKQEPSKKHWYDDFRWFKSSEGFLVVAGKDATTNEKLVRKYMKEDDIVFHADVTGSPFVLIKHGKNAGEQTLREAAEFCAAYSKAWKVGIHAIDVYWVTPDQVSKKAPAGEYLPKGAFMIYGKRNWVRRVPVRLAIGKTKDGIVWGPESYVTKLTKDFVILVPGEKTVKELKEVLKKAGYDMSLETLQKIVPYGKGEILIR